MPLVRHFPLPTFTELKERGQEILGFEQAIHQDIRELHIGFLNMMPDAAFQVTERQYFRLVGSCNQIAQFFVHPFTVDGLARGPETRRYIEQYYTPFEQIQQAGLDALIITGANVTNPHLDQEPFWQPLTEVVAWAAEATTSVMCSCLATHALVQHLYGVRRQPLPRKRWGVFPHSLSDDHPLLRDINTLFDVPHSRWNEIKAEHLRQAGLRVLVESREGDLHLAVSPDGLRLVFSQGHPEYDVNSLLKEYKREVLRFCQGERDDYPPLPDNYFSNEAAAVAHRFEGRAHVEPKRAAAHFPEDELRSHLHNTWGDTGKAIFNNWLGLVYQVTHVDRKIPFVEGIDPEDPLGLRG